MTDAPQSKENQLTQILRALREIDQCLKRAAAAEGIQLAAARGKVADLIDWLSDESMRCAPHPWEQAEGWECDWPDCNVKEPHAHAGLRPEKSR